MIQTMLTSMAMSMAVLSSVELPCMPSTFPLLNHAPAYCTTQDAAHLKGCCLPV